MMLHLARRGRLLSALRLQAFLPVPAPTSAAAISSSASSNSSSLLTTDSLHAQYSGLTVNNLRDQLAARKLSAKGKKSQLVGRLASDDIFRTRGLSTSSRRVKTRYGKTSENPNVPEIPKPRELEATEKEEPPIRVPITPENEFARYHRHEVVPKVAPPTKHVVTTALPDATNVFEPAADELADVLEDISVEAKAHKSEEKYAREHNELKDSVKGAMENVVGGVREVMPKEDSALYALARFPVEVVKDMMEDAFSAAHQYAKSEVKSEKIDQQGRKDEGPQELTPSQRMTLYTIGGLSAGWYFFGY